MVWGPLSPCRQAPQKASGQDLWTACHHCSGHEWLSTGGRAQVTERALRAPPAHRWLIHIETSVSTPVTASGSEVTATPGRSPRGDEALWAPPTPRHPRGTQCPTTLVILHSKGGAVRLGCPGPQQGACSPQRGFSQDVLPGDLGAIRNLPRGACTQAVGPAGPLEHRGSLQARCACAS